MLEGIITAMVTPFKENEEIDYFATEEMVEKLIATGVHGIFILGTNGEFHVLKTAEKIRFVEKVVEFVDKRVPVYAGAGANSTREVIELGKKMEAAGADALSVITPFFVGLKDEEIYNHYQMIAKNVSLPIVLYNIPKNTGINLSSEVVSRLAEIENIVGVKDSSGDIKNIEAYIKATEGQKFSVLSGSDSLILSALEIGASGAISGTSNVLTINNIEIYREFLAGNLVKASEWQNSLEEFRRILKHGSIPSVLKQSIQLSGINVGKPRLPVLPVSDKAALEDIETVIENYRR